MQISSFDFPREIDKGPKHPNHQQVVQLAEYIGPVYYLPNSAGILVVTSRDLTKEGNLKLSSTKISWLSLIKL